MAILGSDRQQLNFKQESGTSSLRSFVESTIISESPDIDRITRYTLYWHFYKGRHWRQYNETFLSFNYVRALIDKVNTFLLGRTGFSIQITNYYNDEIPEEVESAAEGLIEYHWAKNKKLIKSYELLQMGSVCGDAWVHVGWNKEKKYCVIDIPDSRHCFPEFVNGDVNKLEKFTIRQPLVKNENKYLLYCVQYTDKVITTWYQTDTNQVGKRYQEKESKNPFQLIPIVHIKNKPTSDEYYAKSDVADLLKINKVYNELTQEVKSIIDYYGTPTTVITGGTVKTLKKGLGNIWSGLPPEANVFNLGLGEDLNGTMEFLKMLKTSMHELSDVPENSLGKIQAVSNTSAAALQVTYQPLIQQADLKWITYGEGITEINDILIRITRKVQPDNPKIKLLPEDFEDTHRMEPVFTYGLPQDRSVELNQANLELQMKISPRHAIMDRLGMKNIPQLLKEIDEDLIRIRSVSEIQFNEGNNTQEEEPNEEQENEEEPPVE